MKESFQLTNDQQIALNKFKEFIVSETNSIYILRGYAGTGKTTLMKTFIHELSQRKLRYKLLASTGRAAKILSNLTEDLTSTVHSLIYRYVDFNQDLAIVAKQSETSGVDKSGQLYLTFELTTVEDTEGQQFYIIDEASMVSDVAEKNITQASFGSGQLLTDLMNYDVKGKFIFVGDHYQLPPVASYDEQSFSPALSLEYFENNLDRKGVSVALTEIMRQQRGNDITSASKRVRALYDNVPTGKWGMLPLKGYNNITLHSDNISLIRSYIKTIEGDNYNNATLICKSNRRCNELTEIIRPTLGKQGAIKEGDLLLVTQNNMMSGLMNGDMVTVSQISDEVFHRARLSFRKIEVKELFTGKTYSLLAIEDLLYNNEINLTGQQQKSLFIDYYYRMKALNIDQKSKEFKKNMLDDEYLNALRAVFGYALTCHKAQGGEWEHVFLDIPRNITLNPTRSTFQWIYTAMTRAKTQLHIVNDFFIV